jgi:uncharacterized protein
MPAVTDIVDLGQLGLKPGGGARFDALVRVGPFTFGEQRYALARDPAPVTVDVTRTTGGNVIRVRLEASLEGPCMRCFGDYSLALAIDHSEVHEPALDPELASGYVEGQELDLARLVRDAVGLSLPASIASPAGADGVCLECEGAAERLALLRDSDDTEAAAQPDPRWAKLRELEL